MTRQARCQDDATLVPDGPDLFRAFLFLQPAIPLSPHLNLTSVPRCEFCSGILTICGTDLVQLPMSSYARAITLTDPRGSMDGRTSPGRFLAYLLAEHDMTVKSLCLKSGLPQRDVWSLLCDRKPVTPAIAEKLGRVFYSPGFWSIRQAMWQLWREGVPLPGDRDT